MHDKLNKKNDRQQHGYQLQKALYYISDHIFSFKVAGFYLEIEPRITASC